MKLISAFMAMAAGAALAASSEPGESAIAFLEKVRSGKLNLDPGGDTALTSHVSKNKREEIAKRIKSLARELDDDPLEVSEVKVDDSFAAVIVRKTGSYDPAQMQVFPVALVRRDGNWLAAPIPASFENTGLPYTSMLQQAVANLEDWMMLQQAKELESMRTLAADRMRRDIEKTLSADTLRSFTPEQACTEFLQACEKKSQPAILALLGGISTSLPDDWSLRLKAADRAASKDSQNKRPWRLLASSEVLRAVISDEADDDTAMFSIGCLDPSSANSDSRYPKIEFVHLDMSKSPDGFWRINPPQAFIQGLSESRGGGQDAVDKDLRDAFPSKIAELHPPTPQQSAELAHKAVIETLTSGSLPSLIQLVRLDSKAGVASQACILAAHLWWQFNESTQARSPLPLDFKEDESSAAAIIQIYSSGNPGRYTPQVLYYEKYVDGWLWTPNPAGKTEKRFKDWREAAEKRWKIKWQEQLMQGCEVVAEIGKSADLTDDELRAPVVALLESLRAGNARESLAHTARLGSRDSAGTLLSNLGYELAAAARDDAKAEIQSIQRGRHWAAVVVLSGTAEKPQSQLYPIANTPKGPRVLLEIDLIESGSRSRDFLNKTAIDRLAKIHPEPASDLREILAARREKPAE